MMMYKSITKMKIIGKWLSNTKNKQTDRPQLNIIKDSKDR